MVPVKIIVRDREVMTVQAGQTFEAPSSQPKRKPLFIKGARSGGRYSTEWDHLRKGSDLEATLKEIKAGQVIRIDEGTVIKGV